MWAELFMYGKHGIVADFTRFQIFLQTQTLFVDFLDFIQGELMCSKWNKWNEAKRSGTDYKVKIK